MAQSAPWRRILVEAVVIVGSILLAFAIDAAWAERQEQALTNRRIAALIDEFGQTRSELRSDMQEAESSYQGTLAVLGLMRQPRADPTAAEFAEHLTRSFNVGVFTGEHPVLTMMLASGELLEAESDSLMGLVTAWQEDVEHLHMDSRDLERTRDEVIFGRAVELGIPIDLQAPDTRMLGILDDPGMEAAFQQRANRAIRLVSFYGEVAGSADEIIRLLQRSWPDAR